MRKYLRTAAVAFCAFALSAAAQQPAADSAAASPLQTIQITGELETELVAYEVLFRMFKAVDAARAEHGPQARVRFQLVTAPSAASAEDSTARPWVRLVGDGLDLDIDIADDKTFDLPFDASYLDKRPKLLVTPRRYAKNISILIATPDLPADAMRLGDLRLVCLAHQQLASETAGWVSRLATRLMGLSACKARINGPADGRVPRISDGTKSADLTAADALFVIPVADRSWSSDALIHTAKARPP